MKTRYDIRVEPTTQGWRASLPEIPGWSVEVDDLADAWSRAAEAVTRGSSSDNSADFAFTVAAPLLVIDLEATCDEGGRLPRSQMEIIEIGAVLVDGDTLNPSREFDTFVRPHRHPRLTPFCTQLTSITQADVDDAPPFADAIDALRRFLADTRPVFCSWGGYDREQIAQDAEHNGVSLPFSLRHHVNLKRLFSNRMASLAPTKKLGTRGALQRVGLQFEGTHHRGIDDARNIARLLPWALGWEAIPLALRDVGSGKRRRA